MKRLRCSLLMLLWLAAVSTSGALAQEFKGTLGQSSLTLKGNWQFHTGDDLAWADPKFNDSKWETITAEKPWGAQGHSGYTGFAWYRRAVEIDGVSGPVSIYLPHVQEAYEVYWNGQRIGGLGKLPPQADWTSSVGNVIALPGLIPNIGRKLNGILAIRVWKGMISSADSSDRGGLVGPPQIGESKTITNELALVERNRERALFIQLIEGVILLLVALIALGMWIFDHRRRLHLWMGIFLLGTASTAVHGFPPLQRIMTWRWLQLSDFFEYSTRDLAIWMVVLVLFGLDRERNWRRATRILATIYLVAYGIDMVALWFWNSSWPPLRTIDRVTTVVYLLLPAYLFVLLAAGLRRRSDLTLLPTVLMCSILESYSLVVAALGQGVQVTGLDFQMLFNAATIHVGPYVVRLTSQLQAAVMVALTWTVYHEQARERERQLFVESEMKSAQEIQQVLVPEEMPAVPGFAISSLYWPAGEVGGDMFQVLRVGDGDLLVVIADVSGKGLKAAMTVSLMVGAVRTLAENSTSPMAVLAGLNRRLMGRTNGGFATCLVLHVTAAGEVTLANAGHLAPFVNGEAMAMEGSLPLGVSYDAEFSESRFSLCESDEVSLFTDGVLEAQRSDGELFGFERCAALMRGRPSVQQVAEAAKAFGQEDDITVVKIARVHADDVRERMSVDLRTINLLDSELGSVQTAGV